MRHLISSIIAVFCFSTPVFAASGRSDHSGFLVWAFLGFCALIVAAQLIPAMLTMFGLVKGVVSKSEQEAEHTSH